MTFYRFMLFSLGALATILFAQASLLPAWADDAVATAPYRLGIFPYLAPRQTIQFYGPVAASMEQALQHPVKLESQPSFTDFKRAMERQVYDIALIQPFDFPDIVEKRGYLPLAQFLVPLVTQFYVRSDSRYHTLQDLRGTNIALPPAESANARMALRALYDNKLIPGQDVDLRYFNSHDSCIQQVWVGIASACGTALPPITQFQTRMHASLRPIYDTPPIPHILFVAHPRVPAEVRAKLQKLIVGWNQTNEGKAILKNLGFPGFMLPKPDEYAIMRDYLKPVSFVSTSKLSKDLVLGVFPYFAPRQLAENLAQIPPALGKATGMRVLFKTASNFGSFLDGVASGIYDVILVQPFDYAQAVRSGYLPLAAMKNPLQGTFFVRDDSPIHSIADFKGKTIAMPPTDSAQSRLARHALTEAGLVPDRDVKIKYRPTHDSCMREVLQGTTAACATAPLVLTMLPKGLTQGLHPVGKTHTVPGVAFLVHQRVPAKTREQLKEEILSWGNSAEGRRILKSLGFGTVSP